MEIIKKYFIKYYTKFKKIIKKILFENLENLKNLFFKKKYENILYESRTISFF